MHFSGALGAIDVRQREAGSTGTFLHPGGDNIARTSPGSNMGAMPASTSARASREGYADVAVARQCEREGCNVQPSYGKVWKKVSEGFARGYRPSIFVCRPCALAGPAAAGAPRVGFVCYNRQVRVFH